MSAKVRQPDTRDPIADRDEVRWRAVVRRDSTSAERFVFAVRTTGIVCRPGCPARTPLRQNVRFFDTLAAALREGYRPCRRCRPHADSIEARHRAIVAAACRALEAADAHPRLAELAVAADMSQWHFHRVFKAVTGVTPRQYAATVRSNRLRRELARGSSVTRAIYDSGFESSGAFYGSTARDFGMSPSSFQAAGAGETITYATARSSLGAVLVAATERGVCAISLGDSPSALEDTFHEQFRNATRVPAGDGFRSTVQAVVSVLDDSATHAITLPLDVRGTVFQHRVWRALGDIPPGSTATYTEIAQAIGAPTAARAVARACASNPVAVAIPCHRVIRADGGLGGYRWGLERKRTLLEAERKVTRTED
jgi:AraC family transcriptional regulator of adaptative response/methylated-DNA-[protein]-cysteine methyltransferase